ncbi:MAG: hypothetical protein MMC33_009655 [Icmadophila ericetorum]|nr:hypothetical protein [Icmadophila ericetorum]
MPQVEHEYYDLSSGKGYYDGEVFDDRSTLNPYVTPVPHGEGTMQYDNGDVYRGFWKDGEFSGSGKYTTMSYEYDGDWANGKEQGRGKKTSKSGKVYEGWFVNGMREGGGTLTWSTGTSYTGSFAMDKIKGPGVGRWLGSADVYRGAWNSSTEEPEGHGTMTYSNGDVYEGSFTAGKRNGRGSYTTATTKMVGSWNMGHKTGSFLVTDLATGEKTKKHASAS